MCAQGPAERVIGCAPYNIAQRMRHQSRAQQRKLAVEKGKQAVHNSGWGMVSERVARLSSVLTQVMLQRCSVA